MHSGGDTPCPVLKLPADSWVKAQKARKHAVPPCRDALEQLCAAVQSDAQQVIKAALQLKAERTPGYKLPRECTPHRDMYM